ncbi:thioesterase II family protein [Streptomyces sp. BBFR102]|uniref:thioesterase II family protein n=1 Tax=Streptomyces sp. BBFR102 TaxID=3448171 RepID=UPI003F52ECBE
MNRGPVLLSPLPRPQAAHRLLVFPHAGGGPSFYRGWSGAADAGIEVSFVQYAGREQRIGESPVPDARAVAAEVSDALRATVTRGDSRPLALFGHSMGAIIAYETALALTDVELSALFVSSRRAPATVTPPTRPVPLRTDDEILSHLRGLGGTPMSLFDDRAIRELYLPVLRADFHLVDTYIPGRDSYALPLPVTAMWGTKDPSADAALMTPWHETTTDRFCRHLFDGGHFYLVDHFDSVLKLVREHLGVSPQQATGRVGRPVREATGRGLTARSVRRSPR